MQIKEGFIRQLSQHKLVPKVSVLVAVPFFGDSMYY